MTVHQLDIVPFAAQVNEDVIEVIKDALARAEAGEFSGIAIAGVKRTSDGVFVRHSKSDAMTGLVAAAAVLNHDVLSAWQAG